MRLKINQKWLFYIRNQPEMTVQDFKLTILKSKVNQNDHFRWKSYQKWSLKIHYLPKTTIFDSEIAESDHFRAKICLKWPFLIPNSHWKDFAQNIWFLTFISWFESEKRILALNYKTWIRFPKNIIFFKLKYIMFRLNSEKFQNF